MRVVGQPRLPMGPSADLLSWVQGLEDVGAGTGGLCTVGTHHLEIVLCLQEMLLPLLLRLMWQAL